MKNYYCLIAGLPELHIDDSKLKTDMVTFKEELKQILSKHDYQLIQLLFRQYDNENLLNYFKDKETEFSPLGNLSKEAIEKIIQDIRDDQKLESLLCPEYLKNFINCKLQEQPYIQELSWEDQLATLYYDEAGHCSNRFVSQWFDFNLTIQNIFTAVNCKKYEWPVEHAIVGTSEKSQLLRENHSSDFGLSGIFPEINEILHISEENDFHEREFKTDLLRWKWLEEKSFFNYFSTERIIVFIIQSMIIERWTGLNQESGEQTFRKLISDLQHSYTFPEEFKI